MGFVAGLEIGDVVVCGASGTASCSQAVKLSISDKLLVFSRLLQSRWYKDDFGMRKSLILPFGTISYLRPCNASADNDVLGLTDSGTD